MNKPVSDYKIEPIFDHKIGELNVYSHYMKCPFNPGHVIQKRRMERHLKKIHNVKEFRIGIFGEEFDDQIFWYWDNI